MKKTLLFIALIATTSFFAQTELVKNGTCDDHGTGSDTSNTGDNADAWDMTPNSTLNGDITSPYRYDADDNPTGWRNDDLETYLETTYASGGSVNEQPGSTSDGTYNDTEKTRGVKLYGVTRRLYQRVVVEAGAEYTFTIQSRSSDSGTPSEVFMLNEAITTEVGLVVDGVSDSRVDYFHEIKNDMNSSSGSVGNNTFTTTTFDFTASTTDVIIYVRSLSSTSDKQVYFDNISLVKKVTASVKDVFGANFGMYPNPTKTNFSFSSKASVDSVEIFNVIGKSVSKVSAIKNNRINVSNLKSGIYFVKFNSGKSSITKKLVKQ
ncbi:putative secreted protein (Por secretion system target) [Lutibacter sp. Hel_I_33_5]|uniref:T9SS type A sorting domain-containing protein n=1 Tax=Lutibacter sp. Hel_I_33_5 TaxID=1566289 RepID=UPI0011AAB159|nr:T9SS type A sorting domain-containing protein [Lutibacter sp. Hel_I_33_5]TVZ57321.1 putative secreted protein (Por secretion system target) [Lutibacter sp. Hel_I_33_5]